MTIAPGPATRSLNAQIAAEVRAEMGRRGMANAELARKLGVSEAWTTRRLGRKADTVLNLVDLQRIAAALQTPLSTFFTPEIREAVQQATAHYFQGPERTSDQAPTPPARPRDTRPPRQLAPTGPGRSAHLPRSGREKRNG